MCEVGPASAADEGVYVKLPGVEQPVVDAAKVREYLLSDSHPVGRFRAAFFVALGYSRADWERLTADLRRHAVDNDALPTEANEYGQKYEVHGNIEGPSGHVAALVTVWIVLRGEHVPRFVTAFPGARS